MTEQLKIHDRPPTDRQVGWLRERIRMNKKHFLKESRHNKRRAIILKFSVVVIGSIITVVLGIKSTSFVFLPSDLVSNIALVLSAVVTVLSALDTMMDFKWTWVNYSMMLTRIYALDDELEYLVCQNNEPSVEELDAIFYRLQKTLSDANESWMDRRSRGERSPHQPGDGSP